MPNRLARLFRALTPYRQTEFGERTGIHPSTIGHFEIGDEEPGAGHLEAMARVARMTVEAGREMLLWHDSLDRPRVRAGRGVEALYAKVGEELRARLERAYQSLLRLPAPADRKQGIDEQMALLELAEAERSAAGRISRRRSRASWISVAVRGRRRGREPGVSQCPGFLDQVIGREDLGGDSFPIARRRHDGVVSVFPEGGKEASTMSDMPDYMNRVTGWDLVVKAYNVNELELLFMKPKREALGVIRDRFRELTAERAALTARKQDVAKEMRSLFREGEKLADALRTVAREHYGLNSEKLVEFGMLPNRPRSRNSQMVDRPKPPVEPEVTETETPPSPNSKE